MAIPKLRYADAKTEECSGIPPARPAQRVGLFGDPSLWPPQNLALAYSPSRQPRRFVVGRVALFLKTGRYAQHVGSDATVYLFRVLEYLATEVLELARNAARRIGSYRGTSTWLQPRRFVVGRVALFLKTGRYAQHVGSDATVYLFRVLEYLAAEVLELARNAARRTGSYRGTSTWL
ncbi:hypothetical protein Taro_027024 [Colocasia esculenta]|uniref:Histone H2A n=1 Tax=Colocasia esculenta TaxID=4460 RepID=A0A843VEI3_COLES|nr:hypothetical protein [Colocasia esculenta]